MKPVSAGYADVNGITLYHDIYGRGEPLVLVHGGLTTVAQMQGWIEPLANTRQVIAVEMQGHGHTADTDRPMRFNTLGDDLAALLDHLGLPKADLVGHSFGAASSIRAAIQHPTQVRRLVVISSPYASSGWFPEARAGMSQVGAHMLFTDNDSIAQRHIAEFFALLGGGVTEPGWVNTKLSTSRLPVVTGYSHYNLLASPEVPQIVERFLADLPGGHT